MHDILELMRKHVHTFDARIEKRIKSLPDWTRAWMLFASYLGQPIITGGVAALLIGFGYGSNNAPLRNAAIVALGTLFVGSMLKLIMRRDRPVTEYVEHMFIDSYSFPSGHAAGSVPVFGLVAYLLFGLGQLWALILALIITFIIILIGLSRVYLGAHYATDVIGGWIVGCGGLAIIIFLIQPSL